jgi:hypothetical protein
MDAEQAYHYWHISQWISSTKYSLKCCWNHCTAVALTSSSNPCSQPLNSTNVEPFETVLFPPCVQVCSRGMSLLFDNSCQSVARTAHDMLCCMWWKLCWTSCHVARIFPCMLLAYWRHCQRDIDLCLMKMSVLRQCSGSICCPGCSLQAESISWYVSGMPTSSSMGVVFNGLCFFPRLVPKCVSYEQSPFIHTLDVFMTYCPSYYDKIFIFVINIFRM